MALTAKQERRKQQENDRVVQLQAAQAAISPTLEETVVAKEDSEQKRLKFLRIRSWREIYGTGEGRELMQAPQDRSKSLNLLIPTRKAKKSISTPVHEETVAAGGVPPPVLTITVPEKRPSPPSSPPGTPTTTIVCSGAFMQEMDEDEMNESDSAIVRDLDARNGYQSRQSSTSDSGEPQVFADHGLSYYDPSQMICPPPPPPPPPPPLPDLSTIELEPQDSIDEDQEFYDLPMEADYGQPPPPPPPPPLPESRAFATDLLFEIQRGASLRHIQVWDAGGMRVTSRLYSLGLFQSDEASSVTAPIATESPQLSLLQQIKLVRSEWGLLRVWTSSSLTLLGTIRNRAVCVTLSRRCLASRRPPRVHSPTRSPASSSADRPSRMIRTAAILNRPQAAATGDAGPANGLMPR